MSVTQLFANEEMRFQAMYTILCGEPDLNMCRAFMPYQCHRKDGTQFNYENLQHLREWDTKDWYHNENPEILWSPVDLHGALTETCGYSRDLPDFKHWRNVVGKRINFSKSYGAGLNKVIGMFPDFSVERCREINDAYYKTYPGLLNYHKFCEHICQTEEYAENLFFVKYYNISAHKCKNRLIQGSAASFLKIKIKEIDDFIRNNNLKSVMFATVHDEFDFYIWPGEEHYIEDIQAIMENWPDALIPIVAEPDYGTVSWADTKDHSYYAWKESQKNEL